MMDAYLKGFNDGYTKAMEQQSKDVKVDVTMDGKKIAEALKPHITLLQKKEESVRKQFGSEI